jgi:hypothetical protein
MEANTLYQLLKHGYNWLSNLSRAKAARKQESITALRRVITASRETAVYLRQYTEHKKRDYKVERSLTLLWTELGFALDDLGLTKLAKRCQVTGKHWSDPSYYQEDFLAKADISLDRMERLAKELLIELDA